MSMYHVPESLRKEFSAHEMAEFMEQFKEFDTSGDGAVDAEELSTMMESLNIRMERKELLELIAKVDENGSGLIEFCEFVRMMSNLRRGKSNKLSKFIQMSKQAFQIREEFKSLMSAPIPGCRIEPFPRDMRQWYVYLDGPLGTPYEGGVFRFHFQFGYDYPYEPPSVILNTRIYHVNYIMLLNGTAATEWLPTLWTPGTKCVMLPSKKLDWRAKTLLERLIQIFQEPEPELMIPIYNVQNIPPTIGTTARSFGVDCFNKFIQEREEYDQCARKTTMEYATTHTASSSS